MHHHPRRPARSQRTPRPTLRHHIAVNTRAIAISAIMAVVPVAAVAMMDGASIQLSTISIPLPQLPSSPPPKSIDDRELDCLASNIYHEARNQSQLGQLAVGMVTVIRARANRWAKSVCGVVYQPKQFSWTANRRGHIRGHRDTIEYLHALNLSSRILYGEFDELLPIFEADHYHTTNVSPKWAQKLQRVAVIDDHVFYVDRSE